MSDVELPYAVRATAEVRMTLLRGRRRVFRYDVRYHDGRELYGVDIDRALDGRHLPADAWATRAAAEAACPEEGTGAWVEYAYGRRLDEEPGPEDSAGS